MIIPTPSPSRRRLLNLPLFCTTCLKGSIRSIRITLRFPPPCLEFLTPVTHRCRLNRPRHSHGYTHSIDYSPIPRRPRPRELEITRYAPSFSHESRDDDGLCTQNGCNTRCHYPCATSLLSAETHDAARGRSSHLQQASAPPHLEALNSPHTARFHIAPWHSGTYQKD